MDNYESENNDLENELPLDEMAVMQEPPFDPGDTPPSGIARRVEGGEAHKTNPRITDLIRTPGSVPWLNWALYGGALLITLLAGYLYLQENTAPPPAPPPHPAPFIEPPLVHSNLPTSP